MYRIFIVFLLLATAQCGAIADTTGNQPDSATLLLQQVAILQEVVNTRIAYFKPATKATEALQLLANIFNSLTLLGRDKGFPEVRWFLDRIWDAVGPVGVAVSLGQDVAPVRNKIGRYIIGGADRPLNRVLTSSFCFVVMQHIYTDLLEVLDLIPAQQA